MAILSRITLSKANDQTLTLVGLRDADSNSYLNAATVTATLYDSSGSAVTGLNGITLSYVSSTDGNYKGYVESTFDPSPGVNYTLKVDATEGSVVGHWEIPVTVKVRAT